MILRLLSAGVANTNHGVGVHLSDINLTKCVQCRNEGLPSKQRFVLMTFSIPDLLLDMESFLSVQTILVDDMCLIMECFGETF